MAKKVTRKVYSIYQNENLVGAKVPKAEIRRKIAKRKFIYSYFLYEAAKEWLNGRYDHVSVELNGMDLFAVSDKGVTCEIEVKLADYDLYKEKSRDSKIFKHTSYSEGDVFCPTFFYFLVPDNLKVKATKFCEGNFPKYGIITYSKKRRNKLLVIRESEKLTDKMFDGNLLVR